MFKSIKPQVWAFDAEWVPDPLAGRLLHHLPEETPDLEVMERMWKEGGGTAEEPQPYLKTVLCRIVSISAVIRLERPQGQVSLQLRSLPGQLDDPAQLRESHVVGSFLQALGERQPQLVGYNSTSADLKAMIQRGVVLGLHSPRFCNRPDKPWQGVDYFTRGNEWHVDLKEVLSGWGSGSPSLHEAATLSGIPGKMGVDGLMVPRMWLNGEMERIVAYNEYDALTTYLLWLRVAHFAGHFSSEQYALEEARVEELLEGKREAAPHLGRYLEAWRTLRKVARGG